MVLPFHCGNHSLRASAFLRQSQPPGFCLSAALAASRARAYLAAKTNQFLVTSTYPTQPSLIRVVYACLHAVCVRGMLMMYACLHAVCVRGMLKRGTLKLKGQHKWSKSDILSPFCPFAA